MRRQFFRHRIIALFGTGAPHALIDFREIIGIRIVVEMTNDKAALAGQLAGRNIRAIAEIARHAQYQIAFLLAHIRGIIEDA